MSSDTQYRSYWGIHSPVRVDPLGLMSGFASLQLSGTAARPL